MTRTRQFSMQRLLVAVALCSLAAACFTGWTGGTLLSLFGAAAVPACLAAACASLFATFKQTLFAWGAAFAMTLLGFCLIGGLLFLLGTGLDAL